MGVGDHNAEDAAPRGPIILSPPDQTSIPIGDVTFSGTAEPSCHILIRDWLVPVARCTADETGHWTATVPDLPMGTHLLVAEWVDQDEQLIATSRAWTVHVLHAREWDARNATPPQGRHGLLHPRRRADRVVEPPSAPAEPVVELPRASKEPAPKRLEDEDASHAPAPASGGKAAPSIVHPESGSQVGCTLTLYGTSKAGRLLEVLDDMTPVARTESDDTGYWTAILKDLSPGPHQLQARTIENGSDADGISTPVEVVVRERLSAGNVDHP